MINFCLWCCFSLLMLAHACQSISPNHIAGFPNYLSSTIKQTTLDAMPTRFRCRRSYFNSMAYIHVATVFIVAQSRPRLTLTICFVQKSRCYSINNTHNLLSFALICNGILANATSVSLGDTLC